MNAKAIPGYPGYFITKDGHLFSTKRGVLIKRKCTEGSYRKGKFLPYRKAHVVDANGKTRYIGVHRLIALAYHGPCPKGFHAAHLDGDPANNHVDNIRWCSPKENCAHRIEHGTDPSGERAPWSKLNEEAVEYIRQHYKVINQNKSNAKELAKKFGVHRSTISKAFNGVHWARKSSKQGEK